MVLLALALGASVLQPADIVQSKNGKELVMYAPDMPTNSNEYWYAQSFKPDKSYVQSVMAQVRWKSPQMFPLPWVSVYLVESLDGWNDEYGEGNYIAKRDNIVPIRNNAFPAIVPVQQHLDTSKTYWILVRPKTYVEGTDSLYILASVDYNPYTGGILKKWEGEWPYCNLAYDMAFIVSTDEATNYVTCYQCQNGEIAESEFENSCPTGWTLTPPTDCGGNGDEVICWQCSGNNAMSQPFQSGTECGIGVAVAYPYSTEPDCNDGITVKVWAKDSSGSLLDGAEITLSDSLGHTTKRTTEATGYVQFFNTPTGIYAVTGTLTGYTATGGDLTVGNTDVELTLTFKQSIMLGFEILLFIISLVGVSIILKKGLKK